MADKTALAFRPLAASDVPMLHDWLCRPHVAQWWGAGMSLAELEHEFLPYLDPQSTTRGYIALLDEAPIGFIQSYVVMGSGDGWWPEETDPGARGIDQFLAHADQLGCGLGTTLVQAFVAQLFLDPDVTQVQVDPSPGNRRAIGCYLKAGFAVHGEVTTPDGPALLMICKRPNA